MRAINAILSDVFVALAFIFTLRFAVRSWWRSFRGDQGPRHKYGK